MSIRISTLGLVALALVACDRPSLKRNADASEASVAVAPPAPSIATIELGRQAGTTLRVTELATTFTARDTVFLAVVTNNAASDSELTARWSFQDGSVIDSSSQNVAREAGSSSSVSQFRLVRDEGWPVGGYTVDVWMDDMLVGTRQFEVVRH
jgi:hypothetical protein